MARINMRNTITCEDKVICERSVINLIDFPKAFSAETTIDNGSGGWLCITEPYEIKNNTRRFKVSLDVQCENTYIVYALLRLYDDNGNLQEDKLIEPEGSAMFGIASNIESSPITKSFDIQKYKEYKLKIVFYVITTEPSTVNINNLIVSPLANNEVADFTLS